MTLRAGTLARWAGAASPLFVALVLCGAGRAEDNAGCAKVVAALQALGNAPHYHWIVKATSPARRRPMEREQIVIGDAVYMTPDEGRWMRQQIARTERASRMADELARSPPADCRLAGTETLAASEAAAASETGDGAPMLVYDFRQGAADKRIWIGSADGLPHRFTSSEPPVTVTMRVDYAETAAPLP